jgi:hypothetical protein
MMGHNLTVLRYHFLYISVASPLVYCGMGKTPPSEPLTGTDGTRWFKLIQVHPGKCCPLVINLAHSKGVDQTGVYARTADRTDGKRQAGFS